MREATMILAHRIALDPNNRQATYFAKACGCARLAYNWALEEWTRQHKVGEKPNECALRRQFNTIKGERFPFVLEVTKCAPQLAIMNLGAAFQNFFRRLKAGQKPGYPRFKKKGIHDSFTISNDQFAVQGKKIRIPRLGWVRMRESLRFAGKIMSATVRRTAGRWFASIVVDVPWESPVRTDETAVGIDWGVGTFAVLSSGERIAGPKPQRTLLNRVRRLTRSLSRKVKGSNNRAKARTKLARLHVRIANIRNDFLHKFTTDVCERFAAIGIEDLNVRGMSKNHALARSILDQAPFEMRRMLEYKAPMYGSVVITANRWEPTSKRCHVCGKVRASLSLGVRRWTCEGCGAEHDRDGNASQNLKQIAVSSTVNACGDGSAGGRLIAACETAAYEAGTKHH